MMIAGGMSGWGTAGMDLAFGSDIDERRKAGCNRRYSKRRCKIIYYFQVRVTRVVEERV